MSVYNLVVGVCAQFEQEMDIKQAAKSGNKQVAVRFVMLVT